MIVSSAFVLWKTVIFLWYDMNWVSEAVRNFAPDSFFFYYIPNGFWIVYPAWTIYSISKRIGDDIFGNLEAKTKTA